MKVPQWTARVGSLFLAALGLFLTLSFLTYTPADVPFLSSSPRHPAANLDGAVGVWIGFAGRGLFGWASLLLAVLCGLWAWRLWRDERTEFHSTSFTLATLCLLTSGGTLLALLGRTDQTQTTLGGLIGFLLARAGRYYLGTAGLLLLAACVGLLAWLVVSGQTLNAIIGGLTRRMGNALTLARRSARATPALAGAGGAIATTDVEAHAGVTRPLIRPREAPHEEDADNGRAGAPGASPRVRIRSTIEPKRKTIPTPPRRQAPGGFQLPSLELLATPPPLAERQITEDLQANAKVLLETLQDFGIEATMANIDRGPSVTRYELIPAHGVKLTRIVSLADELALVLKAASCHIVAPIPGKGRVGIDVPNTTTTMVYLKEIITAHEFTGSASPVILPIGKDVAGHAIVTDLRDCPHLLIAGATGSGKTVCLNALLLGMLTHASPEQLRLLMIDPKMVELALFNEIPHLLAPVVTNAKAAAVALNWAVTEMERRYQLLASAGVRNIELYNKRLGTRHLGPPPSSEPGEEASADDGRPLPYLVIIIDELADLMMTAAQEVEHAITRLAQLSRAVGLHIVLATQRPSVDVITGVIKANFSARIAFQVASKVDSRTILDVNGADKLLGRGDLLFLRPGTAKPIRAQGAFVTDTEIEAVTAFLKQQGPPSYEAQLLARTRQPEAAMLTDKDELYEMAKQLVLDTGQASTSLLQRRLRLGYGRAARILDLMEQEGLIGPPQGSRPREVLVSRDALQQQGSANG